MSLEYAILGFLNYHPYTGYDLKKIFDNSVQHFWVADQSQIYRTLIHLTEGDSRAWIRWHKPTDLTARSIRSRRQDRRLFQTGWPTQQ